MRQYRALLRPWDEVHWEELAAAKLVAHFFTLETR